MRFLTISGGFRAVSWIAAVLCVALWLAGVTPGTGAWAGAGTDTAGEASADGPGVIAGPAEKCPSDTSGQHCPSATSCGSCLLLPDVFVLAPRSAAIPAVPARDVSGRPIYSPRIRPPRTSA